MAEPINQVCGKCKHMDRQPIGDGRAILLCRLSPPTPIMRITKMDDDGRGHLTVTSTLEMYTPQVGEKDWCSHWAVKLLHS